MFKEIFGKIKGDSKNDPNLDIDKALSFKMETGFEMDDAFFELESLILPLTEKLKENIDKGEYDMLLGDDASGRIPTLILRGIINERNRKLHPELRSSESEIKTRFVAGGQLKNKDVLKDVVKEIGSEVKKKVLVVTEYISSGRSMEKFSTALKELNIPFDIATLRSEFDAGESNFDKLSNKLKDVGEFLGVSEPRSEFGNENIKIPQDSKFYYGEGTYNIDTPPLVYKDYKMSGVKKGRPGDPYATPYKKHFLEKYDKDLSADRLNKESKEIQRTINLTRERISLLVKKTLEKVWRDKR